MAFKNKIHRIQSTNKSIEELKDKVDLYYNKQVEFLSSGYHSEKGYNWVEFYLPVESDKPLIN